MEQVVAAPFMSKVEELADFGAMVEQHRPRVFRFLLASLRDPDEAETLTQETFLKAYRARNSFRGDASVSTWLMHIAVNCLRDQLRNRRWQFWRKASQDVDAASLSESLPARAASAEAQMLAREQVQEIWRVAGELPLKQRTVFLLRFVEELEISEIAAATGTAEGTVKAQLFEALKKVRNQLMRTR
ncbi:MAG: RNA polymerase sigma factor [Acidobacteriaceae bacterium]